MTDVRLLEIAALPLNQRAARIAQLFAEGPSLQPEPVRAEKAKFGGALRAIAWSCAAWARPSRLALAAKALLRLAGGAQKKAAVSEAEGFFGVAPVPDVESALEFFAKGLYFGEFPGLAALWSPARRAIIRPGEALRLPQACRSEAGEVRLDADFDRLLNLCASQSADAGRRPAFPRLLERLYAHGFAHTLEFRANGQTQAALIGVAVSGVFTIEGVFARDRAALARAVEALARHLATLQFVALDFREQTSLLFGLPIELISRKGFEALLRDDSAATGRWRAPAAETLLSRAA